MNTIKIFFKWYAILLLVLVFCATLLSISVHCYLAHNLSRLKEKISDKKQPLTMSELDLFYPEIPSERNAALVYQKAFDSYKKPSSIQLMEYSTWGSSRTNNKLSDSEGNTIHSYLDSNSKCLQYFRDAASLNEIIEFFRQLGGGVAYDSDPLISFLLEQSNLFYNISGLRKMDTINFTTQTNRMIEKIQLANGKKLLFDDWIRYKSNGVKNSKRILSNMLLSPIRYYAETCLHQQTTCRILKTVLSIEDHRTQNRGIPLYTDFLDGIFEIDPFTGGNLLYLRSDTYYTVYSVGPNLLVEKGKGDDINITISRKDE